MECCKDAQLSQELHNSPDIPDIIDSQNNSGLKRSGAKVDDKAISGISGRFPQSDKMAEFKEKPFAGIDMMTESESQSQKKVREKKEIWYIFGGVGDEWAGMGRAYMCFNAFKYAIHCCAIALESVGIDLLYLINKGVDKDFSNDGTAMVCITATQVAFTDLLEELKISPDGIIGFSLGELGCAYADGTLSREQAVLSSYWIGKIIGMGKPQYLKAVVGLNLEEAKARCIGSVFPTSDIGKNLVTIIGIPNEVKKLVQTLKNENIYAKAIEPLEIPYHTKLINEYGQLLTSTLKKIIPAPKSRSSKWRCTSIPQSEWNCELASKFSAEYMVNNLLSPVLCYEMLKKIPENSVIINLAPYCVPQSVLLRSLSKSCMIITLSRKGIANEMEKFVSNIGKLYLAGLNPDISVFHKATSFPVPKGAPMP